MKSFLLKVLLIGPFLLSCERENKEAFCEISLQVAGEVFYQGCTLPISVSAWDGKSLPETAHLYINEEDMGLVQTTPYTNFWNTEDLPSGEHSIRATIVSAEGNVISDDIDFTLLPICVECPEELRDFEGNTYRVVQIGNQCWMAENLRTTHFADGTPLKNGDGPLGDQLPTTFTTLPEPLVDWYFSYKRDSTYSERYGYLYTWATCINGSDPVYDAQGYVQGLAPEGWHIPDVDEWHSLIDYLGGHEIAGKRLMDTEFFALPGGCRVSDGAYIEEGKASYFWTSTPTIINHAWHIMLSIDDPRANVLGHQDSKRFGYSLRCLMNQDCTE